MKYHKAHITAIGTQQLLNKQWSLLRKKGIDTAPLAEYRRRVLNPLWERGAGSWRSFSLEEMCELNSNITVS